MSSPFDPRHLARYVTRVAVRRVVIVLVLALLAWAGTGRAEARTVAEAYALCVDSQTTFRPEKILVEACHISAGSSSASGTWLYRYKLWEGASLSGFTFSWDAPCPSGTAWDDVNKRCATDCSQVPPRVVSSTPPNGSIGCDGNGCEVVSFYNGDGTSSEVPLGGQCLIDHNDRKTHCEATTGYYWNHALLLCIPVKPLDCETGVSGKEGVCNPPEQCPEGMVTNAAGLCIPKANECPAGHIKGPDGSCLPGEGQCAAGEIRGKDGTCKRDADDNGIPDDDESQGDPDDPKKKSEFSGGDSCDVPPSCSGDAIMCGQARIQWRIDCNTRKNRNVTGGSCSDPPICTGDKCDAVEYSSMLFQWRTSCAVEKLLADGGGVGEGGQPEWTKVTGMGQNPGDGQTEGDTNLWRDGSGAGPGGAIDGSELDSSGWVGGGGSCPSLGGGGGDFANAIQQFVGPAWCSHIPTIYFIIVTLGTISGVFILAGRN